MISRIVSRLRSKSRPSSTPVVEPMEDRTLFAAPQATSIITDNRGEAMITFNAALDPSTVKSTNVQVHTAGSDGVFGTADDVKIDGIVRLKTANRRIWWRPRVPVPFAAGTTYSVKVSGKNVKAADGVTRIDGEFNGPGIVSGNGTAGGDLLFLSKRDKSTAPTARFSTVEGNMDVTLDTVNTPLNYGNFLHYANNGLWDYSMFNRQATDADPNKGNPFVIQGGAFNASLTTDDLGVVPVASPVKGEPHTSNTRGTIAMALPSDQNGPLKDAGTDQFFINETNNSFLDPSFTVFGTIKNAQGLAVMDAIGALPRKDMSNATSHDPQGVTVGGNFSTTPLANANATPSTLNPLSDLVIIRRIAVLNKFVAFPIA